MKLEQFARLALRSGHGAGDEPTAPRIIIFGDSHVHAIQEAIKARKADGVAVSIEARRLLKTKARGDDPVPSRFPGAPYLERLTGYMRKRSEDSARPNDSAGPRTLGDTTLKQFLGIARSLRPCDVLVSAVGGNQHAVFSTIQHADPFDFFFPEDRPDTTEANVPLVPFKPLYDHFSAGLRLGDGATITALSRSTSARMVHLLAPPPKRDAAFIQRNHDTHFASEGIASLGVSSPQLRLKFWQMQNRALQEICADLGIETLPPPAAACDVDGFLDQSYFARDATHANAAYGELVLEQLEQCFGRLVS